MSSSIASHPLVGILRDEGRKVSWLAGRAGVSRQYVHQVLNGQRPPSIAFQRACAIALGRPVSDLFHSSPTTEPPAKSAA